MDNNHTPLAECELPDAEDSDDDADIQAKVKQAEERFKRLKRIKLKREKASGPETSMTTKVEGEDKIMINTETIVSQQAYPGHEQEYRGSSNDNHVNSYDVNTVAMPVNEPDKNPLSESSAETADCRSNPTNSALAEENNAEEDQKLKKQMRGDSESRALEQLQRENERRERLKEEERLRLWNLAHPLRTSKVKKYVNENFTED